MTACDGETKSEIVVPICKELGKDVIGVLDLDSTVLGTFDEDDLKGLEGVVRILESNCSWWD